MAKKVFYLLAAVTAVYAGYKVYQGGKVVAQVMAEDLNPASDQNVIYQGTQSAGAHIGRTVACWFNDCSGLPPL